MMVCPGCEEELVDEALAVVFGFLSTWFPSEMYSPWPLSQHCVADAPFPEQ